MATEKSMDILHYREQGLGYKKIAALTGYSLNTVKSVCRRNPNGEEKLCLQCGAKLVRTPHYKEKKFCSDICRMARRRSTVKPSTTSPAPNAASLSTATATTTGNTAPAPVTPRPGERGCRRVRGVLPQFGCVQSGDESRQGYAPPGHYFRKRVR